MNNPRGLYSALIVGLITLCGIEIAASPGKIATIYYPNQQTASAALDAFGQKNASCQLWTNWQNLCSRTTEDGSPKCSKTHQKVKPSTPFCVAFEDGGMTRPQIGNNIDEIKSSLRFCTFPGGRPANLSDQISNCVYSKVRPFSGRDYRDRQHPWCTDWREVKSNRHGIEARSPEYGLYCASPKIPDWCLWPDGLGSGSLIKGDHDEREYIPILINQDAMPVRGIFCRRRK